MPQNVSTAVVTRSVKNYTTGTPASIKSMPIFIIVLMFHCLYPLLTAKTGRPNLPTGIDTRNTLGRGENNDRHQGNHYLKGPACTVFPDYATVYQSVYVRKHIKSM